MRAEDIRPRELANMSHPSGFPFIGSTRVMIMGIQTLLRLEKDLIRALGWPKLSIIFTRFGFEWGLSQAAMLKELYDFESSEEQLRAGAVIRRISGLADERIKEIEWDPRRKHLRFSGTWHESFEALMVKSEVGTRPESACRILSGIASGFASAVFDLEVLVRETSCQCTGNKVCTFEGRPVEDWSLELMEVKQYFAVTYLDEELAQTRRLMEQAQEEMERQNEEVHILRRQADQRAAQHGIIFRSDDMANVLYLAEKVAVTGSTVLIFGESGTGKEVLARYIHRHSGRENHPFLAINCAALPPNLLESELFGHVKGAFTGADSNKRGLFVEAGQGTLFLDEVGELPIELQAKLLRAIQTKEVRPVGGLKSELIKARIVTATNKDLREMVAQNKFREDLYYRLAVFPLMITPLRQRRQDILLLARHFLQRLKPDHPGFAPEAVRLMEGYNWPGNVRELENWVEYAVVLAGEERIKPKHLPLNLQQCDDNPLSTLAIDLPTSQELEKRYIRQILQHTNGNRTEAAEILGLSVSTLWRRLKEIDAVDLEKAPK